MQLGLIILVNVSKYEIYTTFVGFLRRHFSLADARNKRVVLGDTRTQVGICYLLCRSKSPTELMLSVSKRDVNQSFIFIFILYL